MSMYHRKSKCDIYSLNFCLAVKGDLELPFSNLTLTNLKMSKGLFNSSSVMAKKRNLFTVLTLLYSHSGSRLNYSSFVELGIRFQFEINNMSYEVTA